MIRIPEGTNPPEFSFLAVSLVKIKDFLGFIVAKKKRICYNGRVFV